jgi:hypothetical protein
MPEYINFTRTDTECLENVIRQININDTYSSEKKRQRHIKETIKTPIKEIRYIDNQLRIYVARQNWEKISNNLNKFTVKN